MDDKSDLAFIRDTLRQEAMALLDQQHAITDKGGRALALGGTVLAAFAAYGIAGKAPGHELLLRALPAALALIAIELLQNFATEASIAKVREHIEEAFSEHFDGASVLVYDGYVRNRKGVDFSAGVFVATLFALYLVVIAATQFSAPKDSIDAAGTVAWLARGATLVTFVALMAVGAGVIQQPKSVEQELRRRQITIAPRPRDE